TTIDGPQQLFTFPWFEGLFHRSVSFTRCEELFSGINKEIRKNADSLNYVQVIKDMFANTSFTDYLFSLPMGAGKTYLMAAFIYLDLYFALNEPNNKAFAHNFIVCAPSGLKSSVIPSLKTIQNFDATWILPEESVKQIKSILKFEILDAVKSGKKSNKTKNPNVQKISNYQPYNSLIGLVMVTNAEKVILDDVKIEDKKTRQISFDELEQNQKGMNELKKLISYIPNLQVLVDEVHHLADEDIKLNGVINYWNLTKNMNSMIGFSGTPFYNSKQPVKISENLTYQTSQIPFIVNYFPLVKAVESFLKKPKIKWSEVRDSSIIIEKGLTEFFDTYKDTIYQNGTCAKVAIYVGRIEKLREEVYPQCVQIALKYGLNPDEAILCYHGADSKKKYSCSKEEELEFARLDDKSSKKRIVLLAQIGKEGWDCKSLTSVILSQQGDSPRNMILQTTCRCLRQVDRNNPSETALIWLNDYNANILNAQLQLEQETSIEEINQIEKKFIHSIKRYDRTKKLKLPPIDFYQLKVSYEKAIKEDNLNIDQRLKQIIPIKESRAVRESNIKSEEKGIVEFQDDYGYNFTTYLTWLSYG
ncbi:MAG: DEAD/DEAH box helicase family protein, partial [Clostridia bacterium]|nr:DEAD/DEAH box helicase family protein [Clostridia bacterium]